MDHGEPPRRPLGEGRFREPIELGPESPHALPPPDRPRASRRGWPWLRKLSPGLALVLLGGMLSAVLLISLVLRSTGRWLSAYVHAQPQYTLSFDDIGLDPPPPAWYRGGTRTLLKKVRERTAEPATFSVLDLETSRLSSLFRRYPWVENVLRVEARHPNRVVVRLKYREPVALARLPGLSPLVVDREGVLLPLEDIEPEELDLVGLDKFPAPVVPKIGEVWGQSEGEGDEQVVAAARLAAFIQARRADLAKAIPAPHFVVIQPNYKKDGWGLYIQISGGMPIEEWDSCMFVWEDPAPDRAVKRLTEAERWTRLCNWMKAHPLGRTGSFVVLGFTAQGVDVILKSTVREALRRDLTKNPGATLR